MKWPRPRAPFAVVATVCLLGACSGKAREAAVAEATPSPQDSGAPLPSPLPTVAARVNGKDVPSLNVALYARELIARGTFKNTERPRAMRAALDHLVDREMLLQEALRRNIAADESALNVAYDAARAGHGSDAEWAQFLADQGTNPAAYRSELRIQKTIEALLRQSPDMETLTHDLRTRARIERFY